MSIMMSIGIALIFGCIVAFVIWVAYKNSQPTPFNSIVFIHPDHIKMKPEQIKEDVIVKAASQPKKPSILAQIFFLKQATAMEAKAEVKALKKIKAKPQDFLSTAYTATRQPDGEYMPFYYNYAWYYLGVKPLWLWAEQKFEYNAAGEVIGPKGDIAIVKTEYKVVPWEPDKPADYEIRKNNIKEKRPSTETKDQPEISPYITPNGLFDLTDWECARRFETARNKLGEIIKLGVAVVMAISCIVGIFLLASSVNQPKTPVAPPPVHANLQGMVIPQDNGGIKYALSSR